MKRLIFILLFPLSLMAQDTIRVVGQKLGTPSGEWKQFVITANSASIVQGTGTVALPSGGGSTDSSIFATVYQLGLKANLAEMNNALSGKAASSHGHAISEVTNLQTTLDAKLATTAVRQGAYLSDTTKFPLMNSLRQGAYLSDTTKFPLTTALGQGAYLSDTTKFAPTSHTQAQSTITGLIDSLAEKADLDEMNTIFNGKAESYHVHEISDVLDLETNLGTKQATISNLADTSKYVESRDTTTLVASKTYTNNALQWKETLANKNTASGYAGLTASTKLTASQGQEVWTVTDLTSYATTSGTGTQAILSTITTPATNQVLAWNGTNWVNQNDATGSGLSNYISVKRTADTSTSLATPLQIGGMAFSVTSGVYYSYKYVLLYQTAVTTTGIKLALTFPAVTTQSARVTISGQTIDGATTEPWCGTINSSSDVVTSTGVAVVNVNYVATIEGNILPSASGYLVLQWSSETTAAATLKQGSIGYIWSF